MGIEYNINFPEYGFDMDRSLLTVYYDLYDESEENLTAFSSFG